MGVSEGPFERKAEGIYHVLQGWYQKREANQYHEVLLTGESVPYLDKGSNPGSRSPGQLYSKLPDNETNKESTEWSTVRGYL